MEVEQIAARAARWLVGEVADPISLSIPMGALELVGHLRNVYPGAQVFWQYARVKPKNELALWIRHLALHASSETERESVLSGRCLEETKPETAICVFEPLPKAEALRLLSELIELYGLGQERPLPLFPHAAKVYVEELAKARGAPDPNKALQRAREAFAPSHQAPVSESSDPYVARVFAGREPLAGRDRESTPAGPDLSFESVSRRVFVPMLRFRKREGLA